MMKSAIAGLIAMAGNALAAEEVIMLPMRDGALLHTVIDFPLGYDPNGGQTYPIFLEASPYSEYGTELLATMFQSILAPAIAVRQDLRGTASSPILPGTYGFGLWNYSARDMYDTIEYFVAQNYSNGVVLTSGVSADAIHEVATILDPHPAVKAQFIVWTTGDGYDTFYPHGAYRYALIEDWLSVTVNNSAQLINYVRDIESPAVPFWQTMNASMRYQNIDIPTLHWAGMYDIFSSAHLALYEGYQTASSLPGNHKMVMDAGGHCLLPYNLNNTELLGKSLLPVLMAFDLFDDHSIATNKTYPNPPENVKNVTLYVLGPNEQNAPGQYWTSIPEFPTYQPTKFYLNSGNTLTTTPSTASTGSLSYQYDPSDPAPTIGGNNLFIPCGPLDQTPNSARPDVLSFTSSPLTSDLYISGPIFANLFVSSNALDTDFVAKVIDVYPNGYEALIQDGIVRMKWRNYPVSFEPSLLSGSPSDIYSVTFSLWNATYVIPAGHSIKVHVTSSDFPRFSPNPNTGAFMNSTTNGNFTATNSVFFSSSSPSSITLPVVDASQLPPFSVLEHEEALINHYAERWNDNVKAGHVADAEGHTFKSWLMSKIESILTPHMDPKKRASMI